MSHHNYPQTVAAALSETSSKFKLAEALAREIPSAGHGGDHDGRVRAELEKARQEIIDAGGEPKSVRTLADYRSTALWAASGGSPTWVDGLSFSSHDRARKNGLTIDELRANPRTERELRSEAGIGSKDGDPDRVVSGWSPEQRRQAARKLVEDDDVAEELAQDERVQEAVERRLVERATRPDQPSPDAQERSQDQVDKTMTKVEVQLLNGLTQWKGLADLLKRVNGHGIELDDSTYAQLVEAVQTAALELKFYAIAHGQDVPNFEKVGS